MMKKEFFEAIALLMGTVIGAGVLGIPYIVYKAGFLTGLLALVFLGVAVLFMNLFVGEIVLSTKGKHQLTGYAEKYLGKKGKFLMAISMFIGIYGALTAYLIGVGESLYAIFNVFSPLVFSLIFFVIVSFLVFKGLKWISESELYLAGSVIVLILVISVVAFFSSNFSLEGLKTFELSKFFIPYGVILFSFLGTAAIPEMKEELKKNSKNLKKAILIGSLIPIFLYGLFAAAVIGVSGNNITEVSTIGLGQVLGEGILIFTNLFAIFAMTTSFLALGLALKWLFNFDYKLNKNLSWGLTVFLPLALFLLGVKSFISTIGMAGSFAGGLDGILVVLMLWQAKKLKERKPEYSMKYSKVIGTVLIVVFVLGILYQILNLVGFI
jgi:amino acid permease